MILPVLDNRSIASIVTGYRGKYRHSLCICMEGGSIHGMFNEPEIESIIIYCIFRSRGKSDQQCSVGRVGGRGER